MQVISIISGQDTVDVPELNDRTRLRAGVATDIDPSGENANLEGHRASSGVGHGNHYGASISPMALKDGVIWLAFPFYHNGYNNVHLDGISHPEVRLEQEDGTFICGLIDYDAGTYQRHRWQDLNGNKDDLCWNNRWYRFDIRLEWDSGTDTLNTEIWEGNVLQHTYNDVLPPETGDIIANKVRVHGTSTDYVSNGIDSRVPWVMCLSNHDTRGLYLKTFLPETPGTFQDFTGDLSAISTLGTAPQDTVMTSTVTEDTFTYKHSVSQAAKDSLLVYGVVHARLPVADYETPIAQMVDVVSDGTTTVEIGVPVDLPRDLGRTSLCSFSETNPLTGLPWVMQDLEDLEFGFRSKG